MLISNSIIQPVYSRNGHGHAPAVPLLPWWTTTPSGPTDSFSCRSPQQEAAASTGLRQPSRWGKKGCWSPALGSRLPTPRG
jgi:hypothetical protein